jgi:arylsulfatase A-like enzyme
MFDDTLRVPLIASWPGKIPVEGTRPELVSLYDVFPTILDMCGVEAPSGRNLCGLSLRRQSMKEPIPKGEPDWPDYIYGYYGNTRMVRDNRFKVIVRNGGDGPNEFYNFSRDPRELRNEWENLNIVTVRDRMAAIIDPWVEKYSK